MNAETAAGETRAEPAAETLADRLAHSLDIALETRARGGPKTAVWVPIEDAIDVLAALRVPAAPAATQIDAELRDLKAFSEAHHGDQPTHVLLHALVVDIPDRIDRMRAALATSAGSAEGPDLRWYTEAALERLNDTIESFEATGHHPTGLIDIAELLVDGLDGRPAKAVHECGPHCRWGHKDVAATFIPAPGPPGPPAAEQPSHPAARCHWNGGIECSEPAVDSRDDGTRSHAYCAAHLVMVDEQIAYLRAAADVEPEDRP